jgi:uncharacterized protein
MRYDWDDKKRASNLAKHGVDFRSVEAFEWDVAQIAASLSSSEPRLVAIAPIERRLHVLVYSVERRIVRVVSLRKANKREVIRYVAQA